MTAFSMEEFNIMVDQLLYQKPASFDMLCHIADKTLRGSVRKWCASDTTLRSRNMEDDIMQAIHIRLIKNCVSKFFLRGGVGGPVNLDAEGFKNWMFRVALNVKRDYANQARKLTAHTCSFGDNMEIPDTTPELDAARRERLTTAFAIVLNADVQVYKVLTWMAQCLFIVQFDITKIKTNDLILIAFEQKTLYQMRDIIFDAAKTVPWIQILPEQSQRIDNALAEPYDDQRRYGDVCYQEFFMKKGGKATISDWVNRMNSIIKRVMANEALNS